MKMTNKIIALFLSAVLLMSLAGCGPSAPEGEAGNQSQTSPLEDPTSGPEGQTPEADILSRFYKAQVIREILAHHENVSENVTYYNPQGDVTVSVYQYADSKTVVREDSDSYVDIQYQDVIYTYDPEIPDEIQVLFGMEGVAEAEWENRMNSSIEFGPTEGEMLTGVIEADGHLVLTVVAEAKAGEVFGWEDKIEPGTQTVYTIEVDAETFMAYEGTAYVKMPDGTELKYSDFHFSYDVTPYEPSEEMLQVMNGTDKTLTLIADPGTEQEKTYVKSCGGNGELYVMPAEGYSKLYEDEACTQEWKHTYETAEKTVYTVKQP